MGANSKHNEKLYRTDRGEMKTNSRFCHILRIFNELVISCAYPGNEKFNSLPL